MSPPLRIVGVAALAPIVDHEEACRLGQGRQAVAAFMGQTPQQAPAAYAQASPAAGLPLRRPQCLLHGRDDDQLPLAHPRAYAQAAARAGDDVTLIEPEGCDPMAPIDPRSTAAGAFFRGLETRCTAERVHP